MFDLPPLPPIEYREQCIERAAAYIGTYLLQKGIVQSRNFWEGVGRYHSKTPALNQAYQKKVWRELVEVRRNASNGSTK